MSDASGERLAVGIGHIEVSKKPGDVLVAYGLGSCVGITAFDPGTGIAGMAHVLLPYSEGRNAGCCEPARYADHAIPALLHKLAESGARQQRLVVKVAGGASVLGHGNGERFKIGMRNAEAVKELLTKSGLTLAAEDLGGERGRTLEIHPGSGKVYVRMAASAPCEL